MPRATRLAPKRKKSLRKTPSIPKLIKELDTLVSRHVRQFYAKDGICTCYTCGHKSEWKKIHCGHYITRYYKATRWDLRNLRPQCVMCNIYRKGNAAIFRQKLCEELGEEVVKEMEATVRGAVRGTLSPEYLQEQIRLYSKDAPPPPSQYD